MKLKNIIQNIFGLALISTSLLFISLIFILYRPEGLTVVKTLANSLFNIECEFEVVSGRLADEFEIKHIKLASAERAVRIQNAHIKWSPWSILRGRVEIDTVEASVVSITQGLSKAKHQTTSSTLIPVYVNHLQLERMRIQDTHAVWYISSAKVQGHASNDVWVIDNLEVRTPFGDIYGQGQTNYKDLTAFDFSVEHLNPLYAYEIGNGDLTGKIHFSKTSAEQFIIFDRFEGTWLDQPAFLTAWVRSNAHGPAWKLDAHVQDQMIYTEGSVNTALNHTWIASMDNLSYLHPSLHGAIHAEGQLNDQSWEGHINLKELILGEFEVPSVKMTISGRESDHIFAVKGQWGASDLDLELSGSHRPVEGQWDLSLNRFNWDNYQLEQVTTGTFMPSEQILNPLCLTAPDSHICTSFKHIRGDSWDIEIDTQRFPISALQWLSPLPVTIKGQADLKMHITHTHQERWKGSAVVAIKSGLLEWRDRQGRIFKVPLNSMKAALKHENPIAFHTDIVFSEGNTLQADLNLFSDHNKNWRDSTIDGFLDISIEDFDEFEFVLPSIDPAKGQLEAHIPIHGTVLRPELSKARLTLSDVEVPLRELGTTLFVDQANISSRSGRSFDLIGSGSLGDGTFTLTGQFNPFEPYRPVRLHIRGQSLTLIDIPTYKVIADANLTHHWSENFVRTDATLDIIKASITPKKVVSSVKPSDDVLIVTPFDAVNEDSSEFKKPHELTLHIKTLNPAQFQGWGLEASVDGDLKVVSKTDEITTGQGRLSLLPGSIYRAFSNEFKVTTGELLFSGGPVTNPIMNVQAERQLPRDPKDPNDNITVGIRLTGSLRDPALQFYSKPMFSDSDILSYLLIGKPQALASENQADLILVASLELMNLIRPGNSNADIRSQLKLDEFKFEKKKSDDALSEVDGTQSALEETALIVGKQLSENLYIRYTHGLSQFVNDASSLFEVTYFVNPHMTIGFESGNAGQGGDILWDYDIK